MQNYVRNLLTEWRKLDLPRRGQTVIAAVSGGADSVSLLIGLSELIRIKKLDLRLVAAHFNHNLRGAESEQDEQFVQDLTSRFGCELVLGQGEISDKAGNLEQNARAARYRFLAETAENIDARIVLTAHTRSDQAETFLANLIRGSGLEGLGGMSPVRNLEARSSTSETENRAESRDETEIGSLKSEIRLIRPLLNWATRADTENFCHLSAVEYRSDSMNEDLKFNRVRIRKILLPMLRDFNPNIIETLAQTAALLRDDAVFLETVGRAKTAANDETIADKQPATEIKSLALKDLKDIFPSMRRSILRGWLKNNRGNTRGLTLKHIEALENLIDSRKSGRTVELPDGARAVKKDGKLTFQKL